MGGPRTDVFKRPSSTGFGVIFPDKIRPVGFVEEFLNTWRTNKALSVFDLCGTGHPTPDATSPTPPNGTTKAFGRRGGRTTGPQNTDWMGAFFPHRSVIRHLPRPIAPVGYLRQIAPQRQCSDGPSISKFEVCLKGEPLFQNPKRRSIS